MWCFQCFRVPLAGSFFTMMRNIHFSDMVSTISAHDFDLYSVAPTISSLTLYSGWTKELSDDLHAAVGKVLEKNAIFKGVLEQDKDGNCKVLPGSYSTFVNIIN